MRFASLFFGFIQENNINIVQKFLTTCKIKSSNIQVFHIQLSTDTIRTSKHNIKDKMGNYGDK